MAEGAGRIFFAYIGFDSISTHAEEARRPAARPGDRHHGCAHDLHRLVRRGRGRSDRDGPLSPDRHQCPAVCGLARPRPDVRRRPDHAGHPGRHDQLAVGRQPEPAAHSAGDGPRRPACPRASSPRSIPRFKTPWKSTILVGVVVAAAAALAPLGFLADLVSIGTLVRVRDRLGGRLDPANHRSRNSAAVPRTAGSRSSRPWASWSTAT